MIRQYRFALCAPDNTRIPREWAYRLYGWLLEQFPEEWADTLHGDGARPITQFLHYAKEQQRMIWTVNLRGEQLSEQAEPVLRTLQTIELQDAVLKAELLALPQTVTAQELIVTGNAAAAGRARITLLSPCSFKQSGRYAIFPQETLLLQSLAAHWNDAFANYPVTDEDALAALVQGIHIVDYDLHTVRYRMKGTQIPGAVGTLTIENRLPLPLRSLWNTLMVFAPYSGIGIKTALGMGGVQTSFGPKTTGERSAAVSS